MNNRADSIDRRLRKVENARKMAHADNCFNDILIRIGEEPAADDQQAFLRVLKLMQKPDWGDRLHLAGISGASSVRAEEIRSAPPECSPKDKG
jgi:hypothetical protein